MFTLWDVHRKQAVTSHTHQVIKPNIAYGMSENVANMLL